MAFRSRDISIVRAPQGRAPQARTLDAAGLGRLVVPILAALASACATTAPPRTPSATIVRLADGRALDPLDGTDGTLCALIFILPDCPIANASVPELVRLREIYAPRGVRFLVVYETASGSVEIAREHAQAYGIEAFAAHDPHGALAASVGATVSPQAVVLRLDQRRTATRIYRGRIDDLWRAPGRRRERASRHDLADALEAALAGRPAPTPETEAIGCILPSSP